MKLFIEIKCQIKKKYDMLRRFFFRFLKYRSRTLAQYQSVTCRPLAPPVNELSR